MNIETTRLLKHFLFKTKSKVFLLGCMFVRFNRLIYR